MKHSIVDYMNLTIIYTLESKTGNVAKKKIKTPKNINRKINCGRLYLKTNKFIAVYRSGKKKLLWFKNKEWDLSNSKLRMRCIVIFDFQVFFLFQGINLLAVDTINEGATEHVSTYLGIIHDEFFDLLPFRVWLSRKISIKQ